MTRKTDRRSFLKAAGGAAAGAALPPPAALAPERPTSDPLLALEEAFQHAERRFTLANDARDKAENRILQAGGGLPEKPQVLVGEHWCTSPDEIIARCRPQDPLGQRAETAELLADYLRQQVVRYEAVRAALGLASLDTADRDAYEAWQNARRAITTTPSTSLSGLAVKLRRLRDEVRDELSETAQDLVKSALADLERIAATA